MQYSQLDKTELNDILVAQKKKYDEYKSKGLNLDISRGKPCTEQLDLSNGLLSALAGEYRKPAADYRNYGFLDGIVEFKNLFCPMLGVTNDEMIIGGNSSLTLMYDTIQRAMQFGILGEKPWNAYSKIKFICPVPGYDRHFAITQLFGIDMIAVPMDENGPVMSVIEELVANDESIKGIWCVPKYSNPSGIVYSAEVVDRLASMKTAAKDFRIMWDNAYFIHSLYEDESHELKNMLRACESAGNPNRVYMFGSTSKITFPGGGVAFLVASKANIVAYKKLLSIQTICSNKINQLAHVEFFKTQANVMDHMAKHSAIVRPKFQTLMSLFDTEFNDSDIFQYVRPLGGYFISANVMNGTAKEICKLCSAVGLVLTPAGSTFPLMMDDMDNNIRIAPTFAANSELSLAGEVLVCCVKIACITKILASK